MTVPAHLRGSLYLRSKTPGGRVVGFSGHPYTTPRDPGREAESPGSGPSPPSPCTNTDGVAGHPRSSHKAFIPKKLISGECVSFSIYIGVLGEPCVAKLNPGLPDMFPQSGLFCFGAPSLCTSVQTLLWEDQAGSAHT